MFNDKTVKELESLKESFAEAKDGKGKGNEIFINESQTSTLSNVNDLKSAHKEIKNEVVSNGKTCAKFSQKVKVLKAEGEKPKSAVLTKVEIPSKGIYYILKTDVNSELPHEANEENIYEFKTARTDTDKVNSFPEIKYYPHHMAEYIFWTGDEKGVALTIEEFLQEGLISRQDAINFLQSVKYNLDTMQSQFPGYDMEISNRKQKVLNKKQLSEKSKRHLKKENPELSSFDLPSVKSDSHESVPINNNLKQSSLNQLNAPKTEFSTQDYSAQRNKKYPELFNYGQIFEKGPENHGEFDEAVQRLRNIDLSQNKYFLEEVIHELAEIIFFESLTKGNTEAQKAMQRLSAFLQKEIEDYQISRKLQKKILDILSFALMNVTTEHFEFSSTSKEEFQDIYNRMLRTSKALRQLMMLKDQPNPTEGLSDNKILSENKELTKELLQKI